MEKREKDFEALGWQQFQGTVAECESLHEKDIFVSHN
jgi:hypothetical protein